MIVLDAILINNPAEMIPRYATSLVDELMLSKKQLALAESCTGGMLAKSITDVSGASNVFHCGVVSYANEVKANVLGVDAAFLEREGPVNRETARMMAEGVLKLGQADIGIGVTGVAGPGPDGDKPEGEIYIALSDGNETYYVDLDTQTSNRREYNRELATLNAIALALSYLRHKKEEG
ncbi:MAG: CinA family protein [Clostridia bacterium]|nr:CinA family protein [Clostridia bacterium]